MRPRATLFHKQHLEAWGAGLCLLHSTQPSSPHMPIRKGEGLAFGDLQQWAGFGAFHTVSQKLSHQQHLLYR